MQVVDRFNHWQFGPAVDAGSCLSQALDLLESFQNAASAVSNFDFAGAQLRSPQGNCQRRLGFVGHSARLASWESILVTDEPACPHSRQAANGVGNFHQESGSWPGHCRYFPQLHSWPFVTCAVADTDAGVRSPIY